MTRGAEGPLSAVRACRLAASALFLGAALPACGPPPAPPAPPLVVTAPPPAVTAAPTSLPDFALLRRPVVAPACGAPPTSEPGPISAGFLEVTLPAKTPAIVDVEGRDDRDVWLLAGESSSGQTFLHWDGATVSEERVPCHSGWERSLVVTPTELLSFGLSNGDMPEDQLARRSASGVWSCPEGDRAWLDVPIGVEMLRFRSHRPPVLGGQTVALPDLGAHDNDVPPPAMAARASEDVWLASRTTPSVLHWNGLVWEDRSPGLPWIQSLHIAANGVVWIAGGVGPSPREWMFRSKGREHAKREGNSVLRWDPAAQAWVCLPTPAGLYTEHVRGVSDHEVWLIGGEEVYYWDGESFQRGVTPTPDPMDAWLSPAGELWLAGGKDSKSSGAGVVFRTRAGRKP